MSYVIATPEMMTAAATDLATIGSNVDAAHMVAAAQTTSVIPAAADEVSAGIAQLFSQHAADHQALAGQAAAFQERTVSPAGFSLDDATRAAITSPIAARVVSSLSGTTGRAARRDSLRPRAYRVSAVLCRVEHMGVCAEFALARQAATRAALGGCGHPTLRRFRPPRFPVHQHRALDDWQERLDHVAISDMSPHVTGTYRRRVRPTGSGQEYAFPPMFRLVVAGCWLT